MGEIVLLDELTINKIAAGEVIERPASVVKEMVENSIDAGATNIKIEIKNGGISYIRITDNGKGMAKDDVEIAFETHATSKIRQADDLAFVRTMGFRGEALASIAAIANIELITKTLDEETGTKLVLEAGNILAKEEVGAPKGTSITVRNLFFNTPVRYKFLKRDFTEAGYIEDAIARLALSNPHIAFTLINSGKTIIQTSGNGDLQTIVYSIFGKDVASSLTKVDNSYDDVKITGVIGKPEVARANRSNQIFFVNGRYVKDKVLSSAIDEGYRTLIPNGKFPFAVINIMMNPNQVDVNVHPAKLEVRFEDNQKIFKAIYHSVKSALLADDLIPSSKEAKEENIATNNMNLNSESEKPVHETKYGIFSSFRKLMDKTQKEEEMNEAISEEIAHPVVEPKQETNILEDIYKARQIEKMTPKPIETTIENINNIIREIKEKNGDITQVNSLVNNTNSQNNIDLLKKLEPVQNEIINQENINQDDISDVGSKQEENVVENNIEMVAEEKLDNIIENNQENVEFKNEIIENTVKTDENVQEEDRTEEEKQEFKEKLQEFKESIKEDEDEYLGKPSFSSMYSKLFGVKKQEENKEKVIYPEVEQITTKDNISVFETMPEYKEEIKYKYVGTAFNTYIIIEMEDGIYLIDQHAAHERIMYEKVKENFYSAENQAQMMLLPDVITLSHKDMLIVKENMEMFEKAGFIIEEFGENTIKLIGVPDVCMDLDTKELFMDLLDQGVDLSIRTSSQEKEEKFISTVACKAAVKAKMILKQEEIDSLLKELLRLKNPFTCPHGRPTAIKMTKYELERKFSRK